MAQLIKFDVERMQEVSSQLDDIKTKLSTSMKAVQGNLTDLSNNIKGTTINKTLTRYKENNENVLDSILKNIESLRDYLEGQIASYNATEEEATGIVESIANMFDGLF